MGAAVRIGLGVVIAVVAVALAGVGLSWRPSIAEVRRPDPASFPPALVARGAGLARIGDCMVCHTRDGGAPYAGGLKIATPFGAVYSTNITPDPKTGIGAWSRGAFARAMTQGVRREGAHLYPAFPYDHFRLLAPGDIDALYAFLMTRRAVEARSPPNRLMFPLGFRPILAGWKWLYLRAPPPVSADRGAYLVMGLGHCGACHTPHGRLGQELWDRELDGGSAEGWYAPPLDGRSPAPTVWTADRLYGFLRTGLDVDHAAAAGPMGPVSRDLSGAPEADVRAIAAYVAAGMAQAPAARRARSPPPDRAGLAARDHPEGAALFEGACSSCHEAGAAMIMAGRPPLQLGSPLDEDTPRNAILMIRQGLSPPVGRAGPFMPAFGATFTDPQMAELLAYLRERFSDRPAWADLRQAVRDARREAGA